MEEKIKFRITIDFQEHTEYEIKKVNPDGTVEAGEEFDHYEDTPIYIVRGDDGDTDESFGEYNTYEEALERLNELKEKYE